MSGFVKILLVVAGFLATCFAPKQILNKLSNHPHSCPEGILERITDLSKQPMENFVEIGMSQLIEKPITIENCCLEKLSKDEVWLLFSELQNLIHRIEIIFYATKKSDDLIVLITKLLKENIDGNAEEIRKWSAVYKNRRDEFPKELPQFPENLPLEPHHLEPLHLYLEPLFIKSKQIIENNTIYSQQTKAASYFIGLQTEFIKKEIEANQNQGQPEPIHQLILACNSVNKDGQMCTPPCTTEALSPLVLYYYYGTAPEKQSLENKYNDYMTRAQHHLNKKYSEPGYTTSKLKFNTLFADLMLTIKLWIIIQHPMDIEKEIELEDMFDRLNLVTSYLKSYAISSRINFVAVPCTDWILGRSNC